MIAKIISNAISPYRLEIQNRHFFLVEPTSELPVRWFSQENHDDLEIPTKFECFWIPLKAAHILQSGQGALLWKAIELI